MKYNQHHQENFRDDEKSARLKSPRPAARAKVVDDAWLDVDTLQKSRNSREKGTLSNQERIELDTAPEQNKDFLNPIETVWPTP